MWALINACIKHRDATPRVSLDSRAVRCAPHRRACTRASRLVAPQVVSLNSHAVHVIHSVSTAQVLRSRYRDSLPPVFCAQTPRILRFTAAGRRCGGAAAQASFQLHLLDEFVALGESEVKRYRSPHNPGLVNSIHHA